MVTVKSFDFEHADGIPLLSIAGCAVEQSGGDPQKVARHYPETVSLILSDSLPPLSATSAPSTSSNPFSDHSTLVLDISSSYRLPLPSTTRIRKEGPNTYVIPIQDVEARGSGLLVSQDSEGGARKFFGGNGSGDLRIRFGDQAVQDGEIALWEDVLSQRTESSHEDYRNSLALIDETSGVVVGTIDSHIHINDQLPSTDGKTTPQDPKSPVLVTLDEGDLEDVEKPDPTITISRLPTNTDSSIINLSNYVSNGLIFYSTSLSTTIKEKADRYMTSTKPTDSPIVFSPTTRNLVRGLGTVTSVAAKGTGKVIGLVSTQAENVGSVLGRATGLSRSSSGDGTSVIKGTIKSTLLAANTVLDSVEKSGSQLIGTVVDTGGKVVGHRYGDEAGGLARDLGGVGQNVVLVYIDARGITRKALLKSVGKGAIKARMNDGRTVVLTNEDLSHNASDFNEKKDYKEKS